jgi:hypothetical protein
MGSRIMHLIIANQIADQLSIKDKPTFLLGGIVPDAVSPKKIKDEFIDLSKLSDIHIKEIRS